MSESYTLSDSAIVAIGRLLQIGMLTGTDVYDWFRTLQLENGENNQLVVTQEYSKKLDAYLEDLEARIESLQQQEEPEEVAKTG